MDVAQVYDLCTWYTNQSQKVVKGYSKLSSALQHNATQPNKQEITPPLEALETILEELPLDELPTDELRKLDALDVLQYLGKAGIQFVNKTIRISDFDPATAHASIEKAHQELSEVNSLFSELKGNLEQLAFDDEPLNGRRENEAVIYVRFQNQAAMSDVVLLKNWSSDWHDIMRGIAMSVGERPEDVRVLGASNGSIVIALGSTLAVTKLVALIMKSVTSIVLDVLNIRNAMEDLRRKKLLNDTIERELKNQEENAKSSGVERTMREIADVAEESVEDKRNELERSVKKFVDFSDKGGEIDISAPTEEDLAESEVDETSGDNTEVEELLSELRELKQTLAEIHSTKSEILLLSNQVDTREDK